MNKPASEEKACEACAIDPTSHSFSKLCEVNNVVTFYTKPADASKYYDADGVVRHFDLLLSQHSSKHWKWIVDAEGFSMRHAMETGVARGILRLIEQKYGDNLDNIIVTNTNRAIQMAFRAIAPFFYKGFSEKVQFQ